MAHITLKRLLLPGLCLVIVMIIYAVSASQKVGNAYSLGLVFVDSYTHYMMPLELDQREKAAAHELEEKEQRELDPCTVLHPLTHQFIDLRELSYLESGTPLAWHARAFDNNNRNFTLGICSNPYNYKGALDPEVNQTAVGGYFNNPNDNKLTSIGEYATTPEFHGRKLTLTYTNGLYCPNLIDAATGEKMRRSTIITFTCARDMMARASIHFVASAHDCTYFFEVRSHHACPMAPRSNDMAAVWIFALILTSAVFVIYVVTSRKSKSSLNSYPPTEKIG